MVNSIKNIIYLGPMGSYSQIATEDFCEKLHLNAKKESVSTIAKIIQETDLNPDLYAIVPVENSIEGVVRETIDNLINTKNDLKIYAQTVVQINHCLIGKGKKDDVGHIISHPQALSQCQNYIAKNFNKHIDIISANSTSHATSLLRDKNINYASIANEFCAELYGIDIIEKNINDVQKNFTRFVLIGQKPLPELKKTRTSIAFSTKNKSGALLEVLKIFAEHNLNLIYIESRPSRETLGDYVFFADIDRGEDEIKEALEKIEKVSRFYRLLGSYSVI